VPLSMSTKVNLRNSSLFKGICTHVSRFPLWVTQFRFLRYYRFNEKSKSE
jgi:hypothetical protein